MPLIYQQHINEHTKLGVWHITEAESFFLQTVPLEKVIIHPHKRLQHLAGRYLLKALFPDFPLALIKIASTNKPFLPDEAYHFSISHCGNYAAAMVSRTERVGADIEQFANKAERLQHKFLSEDELKLANDWDLDVFFTLMWSIKEALFKWYSFGKIDFKRHLKINNIKIIDNKLIIYCNFLKENTQTIIANGIFINDICVVWINT